MSSKLFKMVVEQLQADLEIGDVTAIHELLGKLSNDDLYFFLSEERQEIAGTYDDYDGQPDEAQEWHDFDPDC